MLNIDFKRFFTAGAIAAALGLSGCGPTVRETSAPPQAIPAPARTQAPAPRPAASPAPAPTPAQSQPANRTPGKSTQSPALSASAPFNVPTTETAAAAQAPEFADLYERIRDGFKLSDVEDPSIDQQLKWYTDHPQYLERTFIRGERYLHYIVGELEARNMPLELALLPVVESAFEPFGYSRARASGLWQFISATGTRFGLKQNWWYDGRRDVTASTRAALDYLQFLHDEFEGDWLLAVAAYNCGEMNVRRAIKSNAAAGKPTDFWNLKLPRETRAYVPKLLAMRRLVDNPALHDIELYTIPNQAFFAEVDTGGQIDLRKAAELAGITQEELTYLNPGFNRWATDPDGPHKLLLPVDRCEIFCEQLALLPEDDRVRLTRHLVEPGETLNSIARQYGTQASALRSINNLSSSNLRAGQELLLPDGAGLHPKVLQAAARVDDPKSKGKSSSRTHTVRAGESLWSISRKHGIDVSTLAKANGLSRNATLKAGTKLRLSGSSSARSSKPSTDDGDRTTYTVRRGDTLSLIARRFSVSVSQLLHWNGLSKSHLLKPGQRLVMYTGG